MIHDRNKVVAGVVLVAPDKYGGAKCRVTEGAKGKLLFTLAKPKRQYTSISMAAFGQSSEVARNGWSFWTLEEGDVAPTKEPRKRRSKDEQIAQEVANAAKTGGATPPKAEVGGTAGEASTASHTCVDCGANTLAHLHSHTTYNDEGNVRAICCPCAQKRGHECKEAALERLAKAGRK